MMLKIKARAPRKIEGSSSLSGQGAESGTEAADFRASSAVCPAKGLSLTAASARSNAFMASSRSDRALSTAFRVVSRFTMAPRSRAMVSFSGI